MKGIRNFKFTKKGVGIVAGALATGAAIILIPLAAQAREITDKDVNEYITNDVSFNDVLDAVSEYSEIDENLDALGYKKTLDDYTKARKARKTKEMNAALAKMGNMLLKASLCDYLGIDVNNNVKLELVPSREKNSNGETVDKVSCIIEYSVPGTEIVCGNIEVDSTKEEKVTVRLGGEANDIAINTLVAEGREGFESGYVKDPDRILKSFQRFLLTTGEEKSGFFGFGSTTTSFEYDRDKVKAFGAYKKRLGK